LRTSDQAISRNFFPEKKISQMRVQMLLPLISAALFGSTGCGSSADLAPVANNGQTAAAPTATYLLLKQDILINADLWEAQPRMIAAGLGFTGIIGVSGLDVDQPTLSESLVRAVGGTWNSVTCLAGNAPGLGAFTSAVTPEGVANLYGFPVYNSDGLPVEFSWPIRPSTLDPKDFVVILNDGSRITPEVCSIAPNSDFNERAVAVLFGKFGNRLAPDNPLALYPRRIEVVEDATPLQLVGPNNTFASAVGFGADSRGTPYTDPSVDPAQRGGPILVGAKLTVMSSVGDGAPSFLRGTTPNDGIALYGGRAQYRLRVLTSGGFSPDGVRGMYPTEFSRYFRLRAATSGGEVELTETGVDYSLDGHIVRVVGLAELGLAADSYDECYTEDQDNQIDIVLSGDEAGMRLITHVEVPSVAPYSALYNPGGPGNRPTPQVRYSAPSPPHEVAVLMAIDDPMTVTYVDPLLIETVADLLP
jgi:hypothetical protein